MPNNPSNGPYVPAGRSVSTPFTLAVAGTISEQSRVKAKMIAGPQDHANCEIPIF